MFPFFADSMAQVGLAYLGDKKSKFMESHSTNSCKFMESDSINYIIHFAILKYAEIFFSIFESVLQFRLNKIERKEKCDQENQ
jgi:hypothetical protein